MHKILVDPGSSTEFLQMFAYKQMGHSLVTLESTGRILIKFNGATMVSLGNMVLLVEVEPVTLNVKIFNGGGSLLIQCHNRTSLHP